MNDLEIIESILSNDLDIRNMDNMSSLVKKIIDMKNEIKELKDKNKYLENQIAIKNDILENIDKNENESKLNPPSYKPSELEIKLAKLNYALEEEAWNIIDNLEQYIKLLKGDKNLEYSKEFIKEEAKYSLEKWNKVINSSENKDLVDLLVDDKWFKNTFVNSLSSKHSGDCTGMAWTCLRCLAESKFKVKDTAQWSKQEGNELYYRSIQS